MMNRQELENFYDGTGNKMPDMIRMLKGILGSGYDISYDGSLAIFYFNDFIIICGPSGLSFLPPKTLSDKPIKWHSADNPPQADPMHEYTDYSISKLSSAL